MGHQEHFFLQYMPAVFTSPKSHVMILWPFEVRKCMAHIRMGTVHGSHQDGNCAFSMHSPKKCSVVIIVYESAIFIFMFLLTYSRFITLRNKAIEKWVGSKSIFFKIWRRNDKLKPKTNQDIKFQIVKFSVVHWKKNY